MNKPIEFDMFRVTMEINMFYTILKRDGLSIILYARKSVACIKLMRTIANICYKKMEGVLHGRSENRES